MEEGSLVWWLTFSFTSPGRPDACALLTQGTHGTRMNYRKMASRQRQCDALGNVLLENLGSCHPCGCYSDTYHLPKYCCRPCTPFHGNNIPPIAVASLSRIMRHKAKMTQEWFEEHNNEFEVMTWPPNSPDLSPVEHLWDVQHKQVAVHSLSTGQWVWQNINVGIYCRLSLCKSESISWHQIQIFWWKN